MERREKNTIISQSTLIPVGAISLIFAGAAWLTTVYAQGIATKNEVQEMKAAAIRDNDRIYQKLDKIDEKIEKLLGKVR